MSDRRGGHSVKQVLRVIGLVIALSACATWRIEPTLPGPGVPTISNLLVEPEKVRVGEDVALTFDFEDTDADLVEARIYPSEVREWVYTPVLAPTVLNLKGDKYGRGVGSGRGPLMWENTGMR